MDHQEETTYTETNGHVTDDVTWTQMVKLDRDPKIFEAPYLHIHAR